MTKDFSLNYLQILLLIKHLISSLRETVHVGLYVPYRFSSFDILDFKHPHEVRGA